MATTEMYTYCHTLSLRVALPIVGGPSPVHGRRCPEADEGASAASRSCSPESLRHALAGSIASQACITLRPGIAIRATTPESGNDRQTLRPACERNREPILAVLRERFASCRHVLEVGSGTGQHAVHFAAAMPWLQWQCSDREEHLPGIRAWLDEAALDNTPLPLRSGERPGRERVCQDV